MADRARCEHGFVRVCGVCDPFVASTMDPRDVAWPSTSDAEPTLYVDPLGPDVDIRL